MEEHIKRLEELVAQSGDKLKQAEKEYRNSLKNLEQQRAAVEAAKKHIEFTRLKIANRLTTLQALKAKIKDCPFIEQVKRAAANGNRKGATNAKAEMIFKKEEKL